MAKKIRFESFVYRFLDAAQEFSKDLSPNQRQEWEAFLKSLQCRYDKGAVVISWKARKQGSMSAPLREVALYVRGDTDKHVKKQENAALLNEPDAVKQRNKAYFLEQVRKVADLAGYFTSNGTIINNTRIEAERVFHDAWANSENIDAIDVMAANEACTAPEMRFITGRLGSLEGKRLLDIGCGLGEASVYFALNGARVTSVDLSQGMLDATSRLAAVHRVSVRAHLAAAEDLRLPDDEKFDVIYAGNLLHHVDIEETLLRLKPHLSPNGVMVTWDPLAYNPVINTYRLIATHVRTPDEHPLKWRDINLFYRHFGRVETRYFWLTTLLIFLIMVLVQRRNPNKERYWKSVVTEGEKWRSLYEPLEKLDKFLLRIFPPLRLLCWNVVVVAGTPLEAGRR